MRAVWLVLSRRIAGQFAFLLVIAGHNPRKDRSINDRLYLIYIIVFFSIWVFSVLTLFASWAVKLLTMLSQQNPAQTAVNVMLLALGAASAVKLWQAAGTSPLVFSEEDALLLCQTPVSRRAVAIFWFFHRWLISVLPFAILATVAGFAQVEIQANRDLGFLDLPIYVGAGIKALIAMVAAYLLAMGVVWLFGVLRIRTDRDIPHYRWIAIAIMAIFAVASQTNSMVFSTLLVPWRWVLEAGMGAGSYVNAMLLTTLLSMVVLGLLWFYAEKLNLSRAAQETAYVQQMQAAVWLGDADALANLRTKRKLGSSHAATKLPIRAGSYALYWRILLRNLRGQPLQNVFNFALVLVVTVIIFMAPDLGSLGLIIAVWVLLLGQRAAIRMRSELKNWWLWTQLPFNLHQEMAWQIFPAAFLLIVVSLLVMVLLLVNISPILMIILPIAVILIYEAGIFDVIRGVSAHSEMLLVEAIPGFTIIGMLVGMALLILPFWFYLQPLTIRSYISIGGWGIIEIVLMWLWIVQLWKKRK